MSQLDDIEREVLTNINSAVQRSERKNISLYIGNKLITNVNGARRYTGVQHGQNKVYTDIVIEKRNTKGINISFENVVLNESIERLDIIVPNLKLKFINRVFRKLNEMKLEAEEDVPNIYGKMVGRNKKKLITGTYSVGGPIDYMCEFSDRVRSEYDEDTNTLSLNGMLEDMDSYSNRYEIYLNLQPLYPDQKYDPEVERGGIKLIYGKSESRGVSGNKIVVTDTVEKNGIIVDIE